MFICLHLLYERRENAGLYFLDGVTLPDGAHTKLLFYSQETQWSIDCNNAQRNKEIEENDEVVF